jgi:hypothetical protein
MTFIETVQAFLGGEKFFVKAWISGSCLASAVPNGGISQGGEGLVSAFIKNN